MDTHEGSTCLPQLDHARLMEAIFEVSADVMLGVCVEDYTIAFANPAVEKVFGYAPGELVGKSLNLLLPASAHAFHEGYITSYMKKGAPRIMGEGREVRGCHRDGHEIPLEVSLSAIHDKTGMPDMLIAIARDVTGRKEAEAKLLFYATHDALTELPNRKATEEKLAAMCVRLQRYEFPFTLLYLDVNKFKPVNDIYGHEAGDTVLRALAQRFVNSVRKGDTVSRIGGDEFVILLEDAASEAEAGEICRKLVAEVQKPIAIDAAHQVEVGISIGVSLAPLHGNTPLVLWKGADAAMYKAKARGGSGWALFDPKTDKTKAV